MRTIASSVFVMTWDEDYDVLGCRIGALLGVVSHRLNKSLFHDRRWQEKLSGPAEVRHRCLVAYVF